MDYSRISSKVLYDVNVSVKGRLLMLFLIGICEEKEIDSVDISIEILSKALKYSNKTIIKAIKELEEKGYIEKIRRGQGKSNLYKIIWG